MSTRSKISVLDVCRIFIFITGRHGIVNWLQILSAFPPICVNTHENKVTAWLLPWIPLTNECRSFRTVLETNFIFSFKFWNLCQDFTTLCIKFISTLSFFLSASFAWSFRPLITCSVHYISPHTRSLTWMCHWNPTPSECSSLIEKTLVRKVSSSPRVIFETLNLALLNRSHPFEVFLLRKEESKRFQFQVAYMLMSHGLSFFCLRRLRLLPRM